MQGRLELWPRSRRSAVRSSWSLLGPASFEWRTCTWRALRKCSGRAKPIFESSKRSAKVGDLRLTFARVQNSSRIGDRIRLSIFWNRATLYPYELVTDRLGFVFFPRFSVLCTHSLTSQP